MRRGTFPFQFHSSPYPLFCLERALAVLCVYVADYSEDYQASITEPLVLP